MSLAYYNENDLDQAYHLRELIHAGHIAPGDVDTRSIEDVEPQDLAGYTQCHFFAGIGGWSLALRACGVPDAKPLWTGSCPCQPFSDAGEGKGFADKRHLWPAFLWLIQQWGPAAILGEQVAGSDAGPWIDLVQSDLEAMAYAFGAVAFPAAGVGAPSIRDRYYWMADADDAGSQGRFLLPERPLELATWPGGVAGWLADPNGLGREMEILDYRSGSAPPGIREADESGGPSASSGLWITDPLKGFWSGADWLLCQDAKWRPVEPESFPLVTGVSGRVGRLRGFGNALNVPAAIAFIKAAIAAGALR